MIKVLAITGIRSEYDLLKPIAKELDSHPEIEVKLVVSGAHLSDFHGFTLQQIEKDGFVIADKIDSLISTNRITQRPKGTGMLITALSQTVEREDPDFLLVVGDREESIATAVVGNYMDVLVAHVGGGDPVFGNGDDPVRMAVSKLSHIHFTTTQAYADNLIRMSEAEFRVFFSGNPSYDNIGATPHMDLTELSDFLDFDIRDGRYFVLVKHPLSSEMDDAYEQMKVTLESIAEFCRDNSYKVVASYPNTDPGAYDILNAVKEFEKNDFIKFNKTLPTVPFVNLMRHARALAGNSSMGILEAPFYKLPVVNIGNRQQGRLNAGNVKFVPHQEHDIIDALREACFDETYRQNIRALANPYGNGNASKIITKALLSINPKDPKWLYKEKLC